MSKPNIMPYLKFGVKKLRAETSVYKELAIDFLLGFSFANSKVFSSFVPFGLSYYAADFKQTSWIAKLLTIILGTSFSMGITGSVKYIFPLILYTFSAAFINFKRTYIKAGVMSAYLFLTNLVIAVFNGFLLYDVVLGVTESFICFVGTYAMKNGVPFIKKGKQRSKITPEEMISVTAIYAVLILSVSSVPSIFGISINSVLSITLILVMCYKGELGMGAAIGVVVGIINGIHNYNLTSVIGAYAICSLSAGLFKTFGKVGVCLGFILANCVAAIFLNSSTEILISIYDILIASVLFFVLPDKLISYITSFSKKSVDYSKKGQRQSEVLSLVIKKRMRGAANAFKELAKMYDSIDNKGYTKSEIINIFNNTTQKICANCSSRFICWQNDYKKTYSEMFEMLSISGKKGTITTKNMPESFKNKCINTESFALAFNDMTENMAINSMWREKLNESRKNASNQLSSIGDILKDISSDAVVYVDVEFENVIKAELDKLGIKFSYVWVVEKGADDFEITIAIKDNDSDNEKKVKEAMEHLTSKKVRIGAMTNKKGETIMKVRPSEKYSIDVGVSQACKDGEDVCGDSFLSICLDGGGHVLAISDGMGSGENAKKESTSAIKLLEGFFDAGFKTETSLELINSSLLLNSDNESFSTMDICSADLNDGTLKFIKICGASSYIKTGINVEKIKFSSLPIGIIDKIESPSCIRKIKGDSMIVMISDGVADAKDEKWIEDELKHLDTLNPKSVSEVLLKKAIEKSGGNVKDDMTVMAARIWN